MRSVMENGAWNEAQSSMDLPAKNGRCARGFSFLQIAILGVLKVHQQVIAYWQIAELVALHSGVRVTEGNPPEKK